MSELDNDIREGLQRLGEGAPPAPIPGQLNARLRRRTVNRTMVTSAMIMMLVGVLVFAVGGLNRDESDMEPTAPIAKDNAVPKAKPKSPDRQSPKPEKEPAIVVVNVDPLPADAAPYEVRAVLRAYLSERGISRALLQKTPEFGLNWSVTATKKIDEELFREELQVLLTNCDYAEIEVSPEVISYSILCYETPNAQTKG